MRKLYISASLALAVAGIASAQSKFDVGAQRIVNDYNERIESARTGAPRMSRMIPEGQVSGNYFVSLNEGYTSADIIEAGFEVVIDKGDVLMIRAAVEQLETLAALDAVRHIEAPRRVRPMTDRGRKAISADAVLEGTSTDEYISGRKFTGKGVVTGIVDMGIDPNHINFLTESGDRRVKQFFTWYGYSKPSQTAYLGESQVARATTGTTGYDHGTHVLGIMAGNYRGDAIYNYMANDVRITDRYNDSNPGKMPYYGMAGESEIIASDVDLWNDRIAKGVDNAVEYAKANGKPCVVNLSLGAEDGPHDGSSELSRLLTKYTDDAILVIASGNSGDYKLAVRGEFDENTSTVRTLLIPEGGNDVVCQAEFWSSDDKVFTLSPCIVDKTTGEVLAQYDFNTNTEGQDVFFNGTFFKKSQGEQYNPYEAVDKAFSNRSYVSMLSNVDANNNRYNVQIQTSLKRSTSADLNLVAGFIMQAPAGTKVYANITSNNLGLGQPNVYFANAGLEGWKDGMTDGTVSDMACTEGAIVVGSYSSRIRWANIAGSSESYNGLHDVKGQTSSFTSYGRIVDGRSLPHVIAPGAIIISSTNKYYVDNNISNPATLAAKAKVAGADREYYYEGYGGTSMAAPFVSGTIALMLEAWPDMTADEALAILTSTASTEGIVGLDKEDEARYGAGLINVEKAVSMAVRKNGSVGSIVDDPDTRFLLTAEGRVFTATVGGADALNATIYNIAGSAVAYASSDSDTVSIDASGLTAGIYIVRVNSADATYTRRVVIK